MEQIYCDRCGREFDGHNAQSVRVTVGGKAVQFKYVCPSCTGVLTMDGNMMMDFDEVLRRMKVRKKAMGLTNITLADKAGVGINSVHKVMSGKQCNLYTFLNVLEALGLELQVL